MIRLIPYLGVRSGHVDILQPQDLLTVWLLCQEDRAVDFGRFLLTFCARQGDFYVSIEVVFVGCSFSIFEEVWCYPVTA